MSEVSGILGAHGLAYAERIARLQGVAERVMPLLTEISWCNDQFVLCGRPDLELKDRISLPQLDFVPNPGNHDHTGNFAPGFQMYSGHEVVTITDVAGSYDKQVPIPVTSAYLMDVRARGMPPQYHVSHISKQAFHRALCIEPDFMIGMTVRISSGEAQLSHFGPEVLLAHAIMSRLVDRSDRFATKDDGSISTGYLCSNHAASDEN